MTGPIVRCLLAVVALGVGVARPLAAQRDARLRERLPAPIAASVERLVDSARVAGLPTEPLVQKALEGASKNAAGNRIVTAVSLLRDALAAARQHLGPASTAEELQAGALWLRAGGSQTELARLRARAPNRSLAVAIVVSAELVARGWPRAEALDGVQSLLDAGVSDHGFLALRDGVDRAVRGGMNVSAAARTEIARLRADPKPLQ